MANLYMEFHWVFECIFHPSFHLSAIFSMELMNYDWIPWKVFDFSIISKTFYYLHTKNGWKRMKFQPYSMADKDFFLCWGHMEPVFDMITYSAWNLSKTNLCSDSKTKHFRKLFEKMYCVRTQNSKKRYEMKYCFITIHESFVFL